MFEFNWKVYSPSQKSLLDRSRENVTLKHVQDACFFFGKNHYEFIFYFIFSYLLQITNSLVCVVVFVSVCTRSVWDTRPHYIQFVACEELKGATGNATRLVVFLKGNLQQYALCWQEWVLLIGNQQWDISAGWTTHWRSVSLYFWFIEHIASVKHSELFTQVWH